MEQQHARSRLDSLAAICMIITSVILVAVTLSGRATANGTRPPLYKVGDKFADVGVAFNVTAPTLVLWVHSNCKFCTDNMPLYQRIVNSPGRRGRIVVMGRQTVEELSAYMDKHGVKPDEVVSAAQQTVHLAATPALVLVDSEARVKKVWMGRISTKASEDAVLAAVH